MPGSPLQRRGHSPTRQCQAVPSTLLGAASSRMGCGAVPSPPGLPCLPGAPGALLQPPGRPQALECSFTALRPTSHATCQGSAPPTLPPRPRPSPPEPALPPDVVEGGYQQVLGAGYVLGDTRPNGQGCAGDRQSGPQPSGRLSSSALGRCPGASLVLGAAMPQGARSGRTPRPLSPRPPLQGPQRWPLLLESSQEAGTRLVPEPGREGPC